MLAIRTVFARRFSSVKVNFYEALGVTPSASAEDIKTAYKTLVKKYHPDVGGRTASEEKFRLITEAYTVLSNVETRVKYDLLSTSEVAKVLETKKDGLGVKTDAFAPHEYGYKRLQELAEERKKFNLDKFYRFRGGVPNPSSGAIRGGADGPPGTRADTQVLSNKGRGLDVLSPQSEYVDQNQTEQYKRAKNVDSPLLTKKKPYLPAELDYEFHKGTATKKRLFFWSTFIGTFALLYFADEVPKYRNRLKIAKMLESKKDSLVSAGMRAISFP